ncbi:MAG: hypothetical protein IPG45_02455 [Deltaproteobacteria bacterium]|jgi:methylmalonyl-CoA mutase|nr:hypothetical protein [Deltaproteobacteria bacterium]
MAAPTDPFPSTSLDTWRAQVLSDLQGRSFEQRMFTSTFEGLTIPALSTGWIGPAEGAPVPLPRTPWSVIMRHQDPDLATAKLRIGEDLRGGADGLWLVFGEGYLPVEDAAGLGALLAEVDLAKVPIHLGGPRAAEAAVWLDTLYTEKNVASESRPGSEGLDPLGLVQAGRVTAAELPALFDQLKVRLLAHPSREVLRIESRLTHDQGASAVEELSGGLAAIVATWRALEEREVAPALVAPRLSWALGVGPDLFLSIATLRAARLLYAELARGVSLPEGVCLHAVVGRRSFSAIEPANNLLRTTASSFAAAIGGADRLTPFGHDEVEGPASAFGRRHARNTPLILAHEAHLAEVADAAGGSWFFEGITDQLAHRAWEAFQDLEQRGGLVKLLQDGAWQKQLHRVGQERMLEARRRKIPLVGVSSYPDLEEVVLPPPAKNADAKSASRLAEPFEHYRRKGDRQLQTTGKRPSVFLATLGPKKAHGARAQFTTQLLATGGVITVGQGPFDAGTVGPNFKESGALVAVIASSDAIYAHEVVPIAQALKASGAQVVLVAGRPGEHEDAWREAGVDSFLFLGCDVAELLDRLYAFIGAHS